MEDFTREKFTAINDQYDGQLSFTGYYSRRHKRFVVDVHCGDTDHPQRRSMHLLDVLRQALRDQYKSAPLLPHTGQLSEST